MQGSLHHGSLLAGCSSPSGGPAHVCENVSCAIARRQTLGPFLIYSQLPGLPSSALAARTACPHPDVWAYNCILSAGKSAPKSSPQKRKRKLSAALSNNRSRGLSFAGRLHREPPLGSCFSAGPSSGGRFWPNNGRNPWLEFSWK